MIIVMMVLNAGLYTQNLTDNAFEILLKFLNFNKQDAELKFKTEFMEAIQMCVCVLSQTAQSLKSVIK